MLEAINIINKTENREDISTHDISTASKARVAYYLLSKIVREYKSWASFTGYLSITPLSVPNKRLIVYQVI